LKQQKFKYLENQLFKYLILISYNLGYN